VCVGGGGGGRRWLTCVASGGTGDEESAPVPYPTTAAARARCVNPRTQRPVTTFQFRVYDLCRQVPAGHVTTYKRLADALRSHPRAVGQALRVNPFAPLPIPCHRVVAADGFIGGYSGCGRAVRTSLSRGEGRCVDRA
jgi:O-6-methylguanine DNA methyltransferase